MIAAIILAAGRSARMGSSKALLSIGEVTFLARILETAREAGVGARVVVVGAEADKILSRHDLSDVTVVTNPDPESGPIGSLRAGMQAVINRPVEGILAWHVDRPRITSLTVAALVREFRTGNRPIVLPSFRGRRGHPVLFGRRVFQELLQAPDLMGARAVVRADPGRVLEVAVDDPAVLEDINTPEDYERLARADD